MRRKEGTLPICRGGLKSQWHAAPIPIQLESPPPEEQPESPGLFDGFGGLLDSISPFTKVERSKEDIDDSITKALEASKVEPGVSLRSNNLPLSNAL